MQQLSRSGKTTGRPKGAPSVGRGERERPAVAAARGLEAALMADLAEL